MGEQEWTNNGHPSIGRGAGMAGCRTNRGKADLVYGGKYRSLARGDEMNGHVGGLSHAGEYDHIGL